MKSTPLTDRHIHLGAKMAEFAGYNMPISYSGIIDEHQAVRNRVGIFDVSHMGEFIVKGRQALDLVQAISSNDASKLEPGDAQYACLPNDHGGIVDDMLVYRLFGDMCAEGEQAFMLVVNASNMEKDWNWIQSKNTFDTRLINISDETGLIAVQGPKASAVLQKLTAQDLSSIAYYHFVKGNIAGVDNVVISATGYTGSGGFELYCKNEYTATLWDAVMEAGAEFNILPCGLGARDTLRLEMGFCLYGNDIDDTTSPLEAGLGWITKLKKNADFPSKAILEQQKKEGVQKQLCGFVMGERRVPRHGYEVCDEMGIKIGEVTSGTQSPTLDQPIGMAYVAIAYAKTGKSIWIRMGSKLLEAKVTKLPFVQI
ncbi:MAG: glycine cleavage system aminomethyltransferase GcvT [Saprospiraceae bacterium]|nr:glycine cleavage system aminomethyltransferase GcvT [Saprospiraceae bacterium]